MTSPKKLSIIFSSLLGLTAASTNSSAQQILEDLIVTGSICGGFDCVNGESFGFDTLRLKENNLRINFDDTSSSASFPGNDWRIVINDSSNGGGNYFAIEDSTAGSIPFRVEAGAPANTLYVESTGDVGIKTANPVVDLHIVEGNTPTLRLEQDGSDGFTPQTWDVAGNETNFFIRDVTNGSRLGFRIRPGAPESSIDIAADGKVGIGTGSPASRLHVRYSSGKADLRLESGSSISPNTPAWTIANSADELRFSVPGSGIVEAFLDNTGGFTPAQLNLTSTNTWGIVNKVGQLRFSIPGSGKVEAYLESTGNLTIAGTLATGSSRTFKTNINPIDEESILQKISELPMSTWSYTNDTDVTHIGPMAEDFYQTFGLGQDEKHIAPADMAAIALITVKELTLEKRVKDEKILALEDELSTLNLRLARLEQAIK